MILTLYQESNPLIRIKANNNEIFQGRLNNQLTEFDINHKKFILSIELLDKTIKDTVVKEDKIIKDKFLKIHSIKFNNLLLNEKDFLNMYDPYLYYDNNKIKSNFLGFNSPAYLQCKITHPHNQLIVKLLDQ